MMEQTSQERPDSICEECYSNRSLPWFGTSSTLATYCPHTQTFASWMGQRWHIVTSISAEEAAELLNAQVRAIASQLKQEREAAADDAYRRAAVEMLMAEFGGWILEVERFLSAQVSGSAAH